MNEIGISLDTVWMLLAAMLVFWMQPGFALCEAGFTRSKNTANILMKNFVDFMFGSLLFFFLGFGFMFGADTLGGFIGMPNWGDLSSYGNERTQWQTSASEGQRNTGGGGYSRPEPRTDGSDS